MTKNIFDLFEMTKIKFFWKVFTYIAGFFDPQKKIIENQSVW